MTNRNQTIGEKEDLKKGRIYHCSKCGFKGTRDEVLKHMRKKGHDKV